MQAFRIGQGEILREKAQRRTQLLLLGRGRGDPFEQDQVAGQHQLAGAGNRGMLQVGGPGGQYGA